MECKVKKAFFDKYTGQFHGVGTAYTCTKKRYEEIQAKGDYLAIKEKPVKAEK